MRRQGGIAHFAVAAAAGMIGMAAVSSRQQGKTATGPEAEPPPMPDTIPDHVSMDADSPHYFPHWRLVGVRFNGGDCSTIVEFCASEGWARFQVFHGGRAKMERGKFVTVKRHGTVEAYWRSRP